MLVRPAGADASAKKGTLGLAGKTYDVAVIGAGCFGAWTAHRLQQAGQKVLLVDAYGPANSRASSGGESRIIRAGYGPDELYSRWARQALPNWQSLLARAGQRLFYPTGVLWLAREHDPYNQQNQAVFERLGVPYERLSRSELERRYPQFDFADVAWGLLELDSGVLMARRAVQAVVEEAAKNGVAYRSAWVKPPRGHGRLASISTQPEGEVHAGTFVFACGPWLPKLFPGLLGERIFPTRQEVYFFGPPAGDPRFAPPAMPAWISLGDEVYGLPDLVSRGVKVAMDRHGPPFDPDTGVRTVTPEGAEQVRGYVARRFPALKHAPIVETRVCQYENTSNGDFLIDRHPDFENVWLVGGGSGHGFKHGPSVGEYVCARLIQGGATEPRFSLASKGTVQHRSVY